jgi:iron complex outermembrane receptor protein
MNESNHRLRSIVSGSLRCGITSSALLLACTVAQGAEDPKNSKSSARAPAAAGKSETETALEEVVVTGTLIRGTPPTGANVIGLTSADVQQTGATTTAQLLQSIPQLGSFNKLQAPAGGFNAVTTNRPNLRNMPGFTTSGGSSTLILVDGHRVVGMGVTTTSPDPDIVPPGMIERVEIVPDGGSAIYGSDAVAGVVNFITRKNFGGLDLDGRYGEADNYHTVDANATGGHSWGSGSAFLSYNYSAHDSIFGRDRDYVRMPLVNAPNVPFPITSLQCSPGTVQVSNIATQASIGVFALPYGAGVAPVAGTANQCDKSDDVTIYPDEHRHSFFAGVSQKLSESTSLDVRGFYMERRMEQELGPYRTSVSLASFPLPEFSIFTSPFFAGHTVTPFPASFLESHTVSLAFGGPNAMHQDISLDTWGVTPTLTVELGGSWQLRALSSYGESRSAQTQNLMNATVFSNAVQAGLFNPYDPASSNPAALKALDDSLQVGITRQRLSSTRVVADGDLFALPGGAVKLAAGVEYTSERFRIQAGDIVPGALNTGYPGLSLPANLPGNPLTLIVPSAAPIPLVSLSRNVKATFAELSVPIVGADNRMTGMEQLTFSATGRYDDYSDFGDTFNPKFGLTYKPIESVSLRGAWGTSFVAPSLADDEKAGSTSFNYLVPTFVNIFGPPPELIQNGTLPTPLPNQGLAVILGATPEIKPQEATTWSVGIDIAPPAVPGLNVNLTYWNIEYEGVIAQPPFTNRSDFWTSYRAFTTLNPTPAQTNALLAQSTVVNGTSLPLYAILDARKTNLGIFKLDGLDFAALYFMDTGFGSLDFGLNANYELSREQAPLPGSPFVDLLDANETNLRLRASVGAQVGKLRAQVILNHTNGYDLDPTVGIPLQTKVGSFDVVNLFFRYDVGGQGMFERLTFTLNVDNVMDRDPPVFRQQNFVDATQGYANGATVGRLFQLGVSKGF